MTVFLTFGDDTFEQSLQRIEREAAASGFFDVVQIKRPRDLGRTFWRKHGAFVRRSRRGYGYWIWKPWLILEQLLRCQPGDVIVYADAGCTINPAGRERLAEYRALARDSPTGTMCFQLGFLEKAYTKGDAFDALDAWHLKDTGQLISGIVIFTCEEGSIQLARDWLGLAESYTLVSDEPGRVPNDASFVEHRHDQSLLSLLVKQRGGAVVGDETYFSDWGDAIRFPFWATRYRGMPWKPRKRLGVMKLAFPGRLRDAETDDVHGSEPGSKLK